MLGQLSERWAVGGGNDGSLPFPLGATPLPRSPKNPPLPFPHKTPPAVWAGGDQTAGVAHCTSGARDLSPPPPLDWALI